MAFRDHWPELARDLDLAWDVLKTAESDQMSNYSAAQRIRLMPRLVPLTDEEINHRNRSDMERVSTHLFF